jgi:hypothetical protein
MPVAMNRCKRNAAFALGVTGFLLAASVWLVSADRAIDTDHSSLKIHVGKAGLFSAAGHDHWVAAPFAEGSFNDSDLPKVAFTVEQQAEIQHTMHAKVLESESYPLISFHSTKIEKAGVNHWIVTGELTLRGQSRPVRAEVQYAEGAYTGHSTIKQTDCGINPISVAGGAVKVKNELEIQFVVLPSR